MDFFGLVNARESVRNYLDKPIEKEKIERCLEAVRLAPSACNSQPWKFIVVDDPRLKNAVASETFGKLVSFNRFSVQAPVIMVLVMEKSNTTAGLGAVVKDKQYNQIDIGIAAEHFCLAAAEEGLGTCMLGWFDEKGVKELLDIPKDRRIGLLITLGYPASDGIRAKKRKGIDEIRSYNKY